MRLIDADEFLIDESEAYISAQNRINDSLTRKVNFVVHKKIQKLIADAPTVDAVEVVRCKDCVNFRKDGEAEGWCYVHSRVDAFGEWDIYEPDDFCSDAERRTE